MAVGRRLDGGSAAVGWRSAGVDMVIPLPVFDATIVLNSLNISFDCGAFSTLWPGTGASRWSWQPPRPSTADAYARSHSPYRRKIAICQVGGSDGAFSLRLIGR